MTQPDAPARVLVVDDEVFLLDMVTMGLSGEGFEVLRAQTGQQALDMVAASAPDLVVLDVMLPDVDGVAVCRALRARGDRVPVLFLTARDAPDDTLVGLRAGGDDYLTKPCSLAELAERLRAILRRVRGFDGPAAVARLTYADLVLDTETREVWRAGQFVELTATEFELLWALLANAGRVLSKARLMDLVWGYDFAGNPNNLETYVSYLRGKLDPLGVPLIQTVRGVGYSLRLPRVAGSGASTGQSRPSAD
jgi:two-component system, OmpR family, response regulator